MPNIPDFKPAGLSVHIDGNGAFVIPENGFLGVLPKGTKIELIIAVDPDKIHQCYTLAYKGNEIIRQPKSTRTPGVYTKNLTVIEKVTGNWENIAHTTQVPAWPANLIGLDVDGKTYNIGVFNQNGRCFLVIEEYRPQIEVNELTPTGMVLSSSPLRGTAVIHTGNPLFQARIHWIHMPFRAQHGFRFLDQGEVLKFEKGDVIELDGSSTFRYEILRCTLA